MKVNASEIRDAVIEIVTDEVTYRKSLMNLYKCYLEQMYISSTHGNVLGIQPLLSIRDVKSLLSKSEIDELDVLFNKCISGLSQVNNHNKGEAQERIREIEDLWS